MSGAARAGTIPIGSRWLSIEEAASYVGVSVEVFRDEVARGVWPDAGRSPAMTGPLWDREALDKASDRLSGLDKGTEAALAEATTHLLDVNQAARILRCSQDTIRRVPPEDLPVYRPGKANLYRLEDVLRYATTRAATDSKVSRDQIDAALHRVRSKA